MTKRSGYDVPEIPLPAQYKNSPAETPSAAKSPAVQPGAKASEVDVARVDWWRAFGNAELAALIDRGIANNPDVRIATLKIAQAKARSDQARADQAPTVSGNIGETIQAPGGQVASVPVGTQDTRTTQKLYQASIAGNWRIDLWGERSALAESANLQVWQAAFERDNIQGSMIANLASTYVEYLSLNDRLRIAQEAEEVLSGVLTTIEKRLEAGDATVIELDQQKAAIFAVRATIPSLEQQREDAISSMAFLVGTVPGSLTLSSDGLDALLLPTVIPTLPSSLILRRPDVRIVEARMLAADADVDVARARILPPLDLSSQLGFSSLVMSKLFQPANLFWNAISNLTVSIFDSGKLSSQKDQAQAAHEEMVETYAKTVFQAVREVESSLASIRLTAKRIDAQQEATAAAQRAWDSSKEIYAAGSLDHLTLLDAGRNYLRYLDDFQRVRMDRYRGYISLFQAVGGGIDLGQPLPGKGIRPKPIPGQLARVATIPVAKSSVDGVAWDAGQVFEEGGVWKIEKFWQVELPGLYHRVTIGPTWRDLRSRYPKLMEGRAIRPRLSGRMEDSTDGQTSWYRLYVAKFASPADAAELCAALKASFQRCRVVSSVSDETVVAQTTPNKAEPSQAEIRQTLASDDDLETGSPGKEKLAYTIQLAAFANLENAAIAYEFWRHKEYDVYVSELKDGDGRSGYAVRTGLFPERRDASLAAAALRSKEGADAVMVPTMVDNEGKPFAIAVGDLKLPSSAHAPSVVPEPPEVAVTEKPASEAGRFAYSVQLGAFSSRENAGLSFAFWKGKGYEVFVAEIKDGQGRIWYAVRTGVYPQRKDALVSALFFGRGEDVPAIVVKTAVDQSGAPRTHDLGKLLPASLTVGSPGTEAVVAPEKRGEAEKKSPLPKIAFKGKKAYTVQLGAYSKLENAAKALAQWQGKGYEAYVYKSQQAKKRMLYNVRAGAFAKRRDAAALLRSIGRQEHLKPILVRAVLDRSGRLAGVDVAPPDQASGGKD